MLAVVARASAATMARSLLAAHGERGRGRGRRARGAAPTPRASDGCGPTGWPGPCSGLRRTRRPRARARAARARRTATARRWILLSPDPSVEAPSFDRRAHRRAGPARGRPRAPRLVDGLTGEVVPVHNGAESP